MALSHSVPHGQLNNLLFSSRRGQLSFRLTHRIRCQPVLDYHLFSSDEYHRSFRIRIADWRLLPLSASAHTKCAALPGVADRLLRGRSQHHCRPKGAKTWISTSFPPQEIRKTIMKPVMAKARWTSLVTTCSQQPRPERADKAVMGLGTAHPNEFISSTFPNLTYAMPPLWAQ